jgi:trimeric autotransporter adhesin
MLSACNDKAYGEVGGTVSGMPERPQDSAANTMVLENNGGDAITVSGNGKFVFPTLLAGTDDYNVTVKTQPVGVTCHVESGKGSLNHWADSVDDIGVVCEPLATAGGVVSGLTADSNVKLFLQYDNSESIQGAQTLLLNDNGWFSFSGLVLTAGMEFTVTIESAENTSCTLDGETSFASKAVDGVLQTFAVVCTHN